MDKRLLRRIFEKQEPIPFRDTTLFTYTKGYWMVQPILIGMPYKYYYSKFEIAGWEHVPTDKPVIFAISHRNAFMDSLAFVNCKGTQVWQLARGDAFKHPMMKRLFYFFHMLPLWRDRDGVDTKNMNQPTFEACADILFDNGMVGIYPEGNCVNEEHIRPLKKGICRIAFLTAEKYAFKPDVLIIPVGVMYSGAEKFKKTQLLHFGEPIHLNTYYTQYQTNPAQTINVLKDDIEKAMQRTATHVPHGPFHHDIVDISKMYARHAVLESDKPLTTYNSFLAEKKMADALDAYQHSDHDGMRQLVLDFHDYTKQRDAFQFRENTFDPARSHGFSMFFMALYFLFLFPVFLYGLIINYLPYRIPQNYVEKKVKQKIFWSSAKYVLGLFLFPLYYLILFIIAWSVLGSIVSASIFLISFPIAGNIAFYYYYDFKKWISSWRFRNMDATDKGKLLHQRQNLLDRLTALYNQA
jgi:1-acyl-sn-glycerol-3-phosphate acyltransferase